MRKMDVLAKRSPQAVAALDEGLAALQDVLRLPGLEGAVDSGSVPPELYAGIDRWWRAYARYLAIVSSSVNTRCTLGCAACCHQNPRGLSGLETLLVLRAARRHEDWPALQAAFQKEAKAWRVRVEASGEAVAMAGTKRDSVRCPLLDESNRCRVYEDRPVACRMFYALTDPEWCDVNHPQHGQAANPHFEPAPVLRQILLAVSERLGLDALPRDLWSAVSELDERLPSGRL